MVYGREIDGKEVTFGTTGYTMDYVFVLYDRTVESLWYPTDEEHLESISGPKKGTRIEFLEKPKPTPLRHWREAHPTTKVLLPR